MGYLLSIVVPTKDRYEYLFQLIELIKSFKSNDIELVVQDNSADNTSALEYLKCNSFEHLKYFYTKEQISISDNSTKAILNSSGEYVCFIGDDDGVTRYIVDAVKWMKENGVTTLKSATAIHKWPSYISTKYYPVAGTAMFNCFSMKYQMVNAKECLRKLLTSGIKTLNYMPKTYNGITCRKSLDNIFNKCGTFFPGPSPDMANAVSLALEDDYYAYVDAPVIIGGHSSHLGGNASRYKHQCGPLEDQPFIAKEYIEKWNPRIPKVWAPTTVWPASAITALQAYNAKEFLDIVDYDEILRSFIVSVPEKKEMALALSSTPRNLISGSRSGHLYYLYKGCLNVLNFIMFKKYDGLKVYSNVKNISEAERLISSSIDNFILKMA